MKTVVLCADDFAMNAGISRGILELAAAGRLSATSVMTNAPAWRDVASDLRQADGRIGCGLHVNLSAGKPLGPMPGYAPSGLFPDVGRIIRSALLRTLPLAEIEGEIARQIDAFAQHFGRLPDFVDGHQHVHVLPGIRTALLRRLGQPGFGHRLWLRDPSDRLAAILARRLSAPKAILVRVLASGFAQESASKGLVTNQGFSGFSDFASGRNTGADFARYLSALGPRPVVMCHPGHVDSDDAEGDEVKEARSRELDYLRSERFAALLDRTGIVLSKAPGDPAPQAAS